MTWQPIETAPKDGSVFIVTNGETCVLAGWAASRRTTTKRQRVGWWPRVNETETITETDLSAWFITHVENHDGHYKHVAHIAAEGITHWMPLPEPPTPTIHAAGTGERGESDA